MQSPTDEQSGEAQQPSEVPAGSPGDDSGEKTTETPAGDLLKEEVPPARITLDTLKVDQTLNEVPDESSEKDNVRNSSA